jgi:acetate kinase
MKILVLNSGSSSIKFELFVMPEERVEARGLLQRIGEPEAELRATIGGRERVEKRVVPTHSEGLSWILDALVDPARGGLRALSEIGAVGHRVVHGGEAFSAPVLVTDDVVRAIEDHVDLAPLHNPPNLLGIQRARELLPGVPQVAVFDTAFHQTMPERAFVYAMPYELYREVRVRRYGFHGTSHRYVMHGAARLLGRSVDALRLITCHLGNGCSITAIENGRSVDTSMGLTPLEGLVMGTRSGDIDPAIVAFLERVKGMTIGEVDALLNKRSGLLGLSGTSNDVRTLLEAEASGDRRAALALEVYCYRVRKYVGAYTAVLGEVSAVVFTAGVGENSPVMRERILSGLRPLGYRLDAGRNRAAIRIAADVAEPDSPIRILVVPTNEELLIARDTYELAAARGARLPRLRPP